MNRSRWRMFLTVFLVVFLGGLGVSGAAALWSVQTTVTAEVATGTWGAQPSPTPTPTTSAPTTTPGATPTASPTPTPTATSTPQPTTPTSTPSPSSTPWDWKLSVSEIDKVKGEGVFTLTWTRPAGSTVVVEVDGARVSMESGTQATVTLDRGPACYDLRIYVATPSGPSHVTEKIVTYHPAGPNGTLHLEDRCRL